MVVASAVDLIFKEIALLTQRHAKKMATKANRARRGPRVLAKERARKVSERYQEKSKGSKSAKGSYTGKTSKTGFSSRKPRNRRQVQKHRNLHRRITRSCLARTILGLMMAGVVTNGMTRRARLAGMKVGSKLMTLPKRFERANMNLDTGAAVNMSIGLRSRCNRRWTSLSTSQW